MDTKKQLGQFFTVSDTVQTTMADLVKTRAGTALEPSAGAGHLTETLFTHRPGLATTSIEYDPTTPWHASTPRTVTDFFGWAATIPHRFDVIFGNPPYVPWKHVTAATKAAAAPVRARYSEKVNLYMLFLDRCIDLLNPGGELVMIVPAEWCYTTAAAELRHKINRNGAITDFIHCGDTKLFPDASVPALCIFRYQHQTGQRHINYANSLDQWQTGEIEQRVLTTNHSRWLLLTTHDQQLIDGWGTLGEQYEPKVGLVTGADTAYELPATHPIHPDWVLPTLVTDRTIRPYINANHAGTVTELPAEVLNHLQPHKPRLINRRIATFDETNWWKYGAVRNFKEMQSERPRFFVNARTRRPDPFFTHPDAKYYSGGIIALFQNRGALPIGTAVAVANSAAFRRIEVDP